MTVKNNQLEIPFTSTDKDKLDAIEDGAKTFALASQAEAEAGLDNVKLMTPLRVAEAISALSVGGGSGEANTGQNVGSGVGVFKQKTGVTLQFKSLVAGSGVSLTNGTDTITITANPGGLTNTDQLAEGSSNLYYTDARVASAPAVALNTAKISADGSINTHSDVTVSSPVSGQALVWNGTQWVNQAVSGSGEANTASNVGTTGTGTAGVFKSKVGVDLEFKRLVAGSNVTITEGTNDITIAASGGGGSGEEVQYLTFSNGNVVIRASGTTADLALITATKVFDTAGVSRLVLNQPTTVVYHSVMVTFTASETAGRTECRVELPEPNGATSLSNAIRPIAYRLNASSNVAATGGTISLNGTTVVLAHTGYTAGQEQRMVVQL